MNYPRHTPQILVIFSTFLVLFLSLSYFLRSKPDDIRVGLKWYNQAQFAGMYVADIKGFYKDENLRVALIEKGNVDTSVIDQIRGGAVDIGIVSPGEFLKAINGGTPIKALAAIFQNAPSVIVSLESKKILHPTDLRGKRLGVANLNEDKKLLFYALLEESGVPRNSVVFKEIGSRQIEALLNNQVDAVDIYRTNELYDLNKAGVKYRLLFPERYGVDVYGDILVASDIFLNNNKEAVAKFLRATMKGWTYALDKPEEAVDITLMVDNPTYHDKEKEAFILNKSLELVRVYHNQTIGQMTPLHWDYVYALFYNHGIIGKFNIRDYIADGSFMKYIHSSTWDK